MCKKGTADNVKTLVSRVEFSTLYPGLWDGRITGRKPGDATLTWLFTRVNCCVFEHTATRQLRIRSGGVVELVSAG